MKLNWFFQSVLMNEAADGSGTGGGGGDSTALTTTTGTGLATGDGAGEGVAADDTGTSVTTTRDESAPISVYEGGRVSQGVSRAFRKLEVANPTMKRMFRQAQDALDTVGRLRSMLGDKPFDKIKQLRTTAEAVAKYVWTDEKGNVTKGLPAITAMYEDVVAHDTMYETANPALLELMTESPLGKFAFVKLFPHVVAKLQQIAPQTYTRWLGAQMANAFTQLEVEIKNGEGKVVSKEPINVPFRMRQMYGLLPAPVEGKIAGGAMTLIQEHELLTHFDNIYAWIEKIRAWSNATPEDLTPPKADESAAAMQKAQRDADVALDKAWTATKKAECIPLLDAEIRKQTAGLKLNATAIADITARARKSVDKRRNAQPDDQGRRIAFFKSRDMNGFLAYHRQAVENYAPEAVTDAITASGHRANRKAVTGKQADGTAKGAGQNDQQAASGAVRRLTPDEAAKLGGVNGTRWMKPSGIGGAPGTTQAMAMARQQMMRKGNPLNLPEGTIVQFPVAAETPYRLP